MYLNKIHIRSFDKPTNVVITGVNYPGIDGDIPGLDLGCFYKLDIFTGEDYKWVRLDGSKVN